MHMISTVNTSGNEAEFMYKKEQIHT